MKETETTYYDSIAHSAITVRLASRRTTFMCIVNYTKNGDSPATESYNVTVKAGMIPTRMISLSINDLDLSVTSIKSR